MIPGVFLIKQLDEWRHHKECGAEEQVFKVGRINNSVLGGKRFGVVKRIGT